jgi:pyruvate/2-oxoglutarate/acetoin dehydrogenase E1 component
MGSHQGLRIMKISNVSENPLFSSCAAARILRGIESIAIIAVIIEEMSARPDYSAKGGPVFVLLRHHGRLVSVFYVIAGVKVIVPMLVEDDLGLLWVM